MVSYWTWAGSHHGGRTRPRSANRCSVHIKNPRGSHGERIPSAENGSECEMKRNAQEPSLLLASSSLSGGRMPRAFLPAINCQSLTAVKKRFWVTDILRSRAA